MSETVSLLNTLLAIGGIVTLLAAIVLVIDLYTSQQFKKMLQLWGTMVAFLFAGGATLMTLLYSEVFGFVPCGLCWFQRIFLYPQVVIMGMALFYKDKISARYGIVLSGFGLIVALYQHYLQMGGAQIVECPLSGGDCAKRFMFEFGFVTFPLLSAMLFIFLIALYAYILKVNNNS